MRSRCTDSSRRAFLRQAGTAASALLVSAEGFAAGARQRAARPSAVGLQLYTVSDSLQKDFEGTLTSIHRIGYQEVETAGALGKPAADWRTRLRDAGLRCPSVHLAGDEPVPAMMDFAAQLGAAYVVTALYMLKPTPDDASYRRMLAGLTIDDYKKMAERCNHLGEQARQHGLQLAYHNENIEFQPKSARIGYDTLLAETDAGLVKLELDCGWMIAAGHDPVRYLRAQPDRYRMLHIKDFERLAKPVYGLVKGDAPKSAELGRGSIDYAPIIAAARQAGVEHYFVEEEPPFTTPTMSALAVNYEYARALLAI